MDSELKLNLVNAVNCYIIQMQRQFFALEKFSDEKYRDVFYRFMIKFRLY